MSPAMAAAPAALPLSHILAPVDFSDPCRRSAETAGELARHFGASVTLLHAAPLLTLAMAVPEALAYAPSPEFADLDLEERSAMLAALAPAAGPDARRVVVENQPARAILDYANANGCDLIVMPTHGYGALHRLVVGSVTTEVLRSAPCPVWTGAHYERPCPGAFQTVLCAVDLEKPTPAVLRWASGFARAYGARLEVIHGRPASAAPASLLVIGRGPHAYSIIREAPGPVVAV
jgi:nucleotide-binding universal stress UspA family protein